MVRPGSRRRHADAGLRHLADPRPPRLRVRPARAGCWLPAHRHRHHVPQRSARSARPCRQRPGPRRGVHHHQAAARQRRPGPGHPGREPARAGHGLRGPVADPLAAAQAGLGSALAGVPRPARRGPVPQRRREQLRPGPDRRADPRPPGSGPRSTRSRGARPGTTRPCSPPTPTAAWRSRATARSRAPGCAIRALAEIAARYDVTPAQVVLRWHLELGITVLPRSSQPDHIKSNFDLFGFSLTPEETARLAGQRPDVTPVVCRWLTTPPPRMAAHYVATCRWQMVIHRKA